MSNDTTTAPQYDLNALLQEVAPLPAELRSTNVTDGNSQRYVLPTGPPQFASSFISVGEEELPSSPTITPISEHVRELLQEYQQNGDDGVKMFSPEQEKFMAQDQGEQFTQEKYEKSIPTHGDRMFHHFVSRIQKHPGQILRWAVFWWCVFALWQIGVGQWKGIFISLILGRDFFPFAKANNDFADNTCM